MPLDAATLLLPHIDGIQQDSDRDSTSATLANSLALYLGDRDGTDNGDEFHGDLDEVKIYRVALSASDILSEYNHGSGTSLGSVSTASDGTTPDNSASRAYCIPGDTSTCNPPVLRLKMDEKQDDMCGGGDDVCDTSGNENHGVRNGAVWNGSGRCHEGSCLEFNGADDYVDSGSGTSLDNLTAFTCTAWIYAYSFTGEHAIVYKDTSTGQGNEYCGIQSSSGDLYARIDETSNPDPASYSSTALPTGTWQFIATTWVGNGHAPQLYINGIEVAYASKINGSGDDVDESARNVTVGGRGNGAASTFTFDGLIDDVRIYNYARTAAQIAWDYNRGKPVAHWKLDDGVTVSGCDGTSATVRDSIGSNDGTLNLGTLGNTSTTVAWVSGKYNCGIDFDGTDDWVDIGDVSSLIGNNNEGTVSVWFSRTTGDGDALIAWNQSGTLNNIFRLMFTGADGTLQVLLKTTSDVYRATVDLGSRGTDGSWNNVVFTVSSAGNFLYFNGIRQSLSYSTGSSSNTEWFDDISNEDSLTIGVDKLTVLDDYFIGKLDDARIYNYALTQTQIRQVYNQGAAIRFGPSEGLP